MSDQAAEAVNQPESILDRIVQNHYAEPDDAPSEEPDDPVDDEPEADEPESTDDEPEGESDDETEEVVEEEPEDEFEEIEWNGEAKKLTKAELKELAQKGFDYTQKTQEVAQQRKALEAQQQAFVQQATYQAQVMEQYGTVKALEAQLQQYQSVLTDELAQADPVRYMQLDRQARQLQANHQQAVQQMQNAWSQAQTIQQEQRQQALYEASQKLLDILPEWRNPDRASKEKAKVMEFLSRTGYSPEEIGMATDPRAIAVALKAAKYDELIAQKATASKKVQNLPKPVKPGAAVTKEQRQAQSDGEYKRALSKAKTPAERNALIQKRIESKLKG